MATHPSKPQLTFSLRSILINLYQNIIKDLKAIYLALAEKYATVVQGTMYVKK